MPEPRDDSERALGRLFGGATAVAAFVALTAAWVPAAAWATTLLVVLIHPVSLLGTGLRRGPSQSTRLVTLLTLILIVAGVAIAS